ncbi:MAG: hypothetical protein LDLANPLL_01686 [Turneriella sp.]|nr:hypothetical protein [Turneriella sp.]
MEKARRIICARQHPWYLLLWAFFSISRLSADDDGNFPLEVANVAYSPYAGEFLIKSEWLYEYSLSYIHLPTQMVGLASWPDAEIRSPKDQYFTELTLKYGITDRISLATSGKYLLSLQESTTNRGGFGLPADTSSEKSGFERTTVGVAGRILGTRSDEWYLNVEGRFQPGIKNGSAVTSPQDAYIGIVGAGWNSGDFTCVLAAYGAHAPSTSSKGVEYRRSDAVAGELIFQFDFEDLYLRPAFGMLKLVDSTSQDNPILRQAQTYLRGDFGFYVGESTVLNIGVDRKFPLSAQMAMGPLNGTVFYEGATTVSLSLVSVL